MDIVPAQVLTQIVGFLLLLGLLRRYAWGPLLKMLDDRREKIVSEFSGIEAMKKEVAEVRADYEAKMQEIEKESRLRIQEAIAEGNRMAQEITNRARADADGILIKAKETIQMEMTAAKHQMRVEMVDLAIKAAEKVVAKELDAEKHQALVLQYVNGLK